MTEPMSPPPVLGTGVVGVDGVGIGVVEPVHWLWHPSLQYSSVLPHQPNLLQQRPFGHKAFPACVPHCSAKIAENVDKDKRTIKIE